MKRLTTHVWAVPLLAGAFVLGVQTLRADDEAKKPAREAAPRGDRKPGDGENPPPGRQRGPRDGEAGRPEGRGPRDGEGRGPENRGLGGGRPNPQELFKQLDTNNDGALSLEEFEAFPRMLAAMQRRGDGPGPGARRDGDNPGPRREGDNPPPGRGPREENPPAGPRRERGPDQPRDPARPPEEGRRAEAPAAPQRGDQPAAPRLPEGVRMEKDLEYVASGHERHKLDVFWREDAKAPLPLVVWIHGGGWRGGSKEGSPAMGLLEKGYAVANINYRFSQHATFPAQLEDCKAAIRYLRANAKKYNLDPDHIAVWGASAGGHLVALLGTTGDQKQFDTGANTDQSSRVQAVVDWFGPADFNAADLAASGAKSPVSALIGGPLEDNKEKATVASPVTYATKDDAPMLIVHGDKDQLVPYSQSEVLAEALKKAGVEVILQKIEGAGHGGPAFMSPESQQQLQSFLDKHLKKQSSN